ncbi:MAG TPA: acyltransferase family protein [Devosia sp.]|jgi:peptidoglycan/LPS O-acetylase OafA/YrhL|uniref:acyltransferase family protein n=1 Tax=Devosia sp. TaxID=1871048 RepID=UPI002F934533
MSLKENHKRGDLQGLRAFAVLGVIAFHFDVPPFRGGFVGVDVFFVLSGFFITRLLHRELEQTGSINLLQFWGNRIKRLLPNALLTILATVVVSATLLPAYRLPGLAVDAASASLFFANFHFAASAVDYFQLGDPPSPLLHFWSLSVEEQFYLALPPLLAALGLFFNRLGASRLILVALAGAFAGSLVGAMTIIITSQPEAFYHPQYRAWQLATGGLVSLAYVHRQRIAAPLRAFGCFFGLAAIVYSYLAYNDQLIYPGAWALLPTGGAALVLLGLDSPQSAKLSSSLAHPWLVLVGDMSYSLYLWHWPVAVIISALWPEWSVAATCLGLTITAFLSALAYYLVERPVHHLSLQAVGLGRMFGAAALGVIGVAAASLAVHALPSRTNPILTAQINAAANDFGENYLNGCHRDFEDVDQPPCTFGRIGGPKVVLFGDSHAAQWFTPLQLAADTLGWEVQTRTKSSCPAVPVTIWYQPSKAPYKECNVWRNQILAELRSSPPDLVIIGNSSRYHGWVFDEEYQQPADNASAESLWRAALEELYAELAAAGIPAAFINDTPEMFTSYRDCLSFGEMEACGRPRSDALRGMPTSLPAAGQHVIDVNDRLCDRDACLPAIGGNIVYRDQHHLTATFAASMKDVFEKALKSEISALKP